MRKDLVLILTNRCNFTCSHCLRGPATTDDIPLDSIEKFLDDMKKSGFGVVGLTGGEPAMHADFYRVIEAIVDHNLQYTFVTNGYNIDPYLEMIDKYPGSCSALAVSLDGPTEEVHNRLRKKGFEQAVQAIKDFSSRGVYVNVNMLVTEGNKEHVTEMARLSVSSGASALWLAGAIPNPMGLKPMKWDGGRREVKIAAKKASLKYGITVNFACCFLRMVDVMKCINMRKPQLALNPEGEIVFCCNTQGRGAILGRLGEKTLDKFIIDAEKLGGDLIKEKMRLYKDNRLEEYSSNCEFCNSYLEDRIKLFS